MCDWGVNIGCLAGTDTAWEHRAAKKSATKTVCSRLGRCASITGASSMFKSSSNVKPGGCGIFVDGAWSSRISKRGQDEEGMGRWAYVIIDGRNDAKLMIITAYRVVTHKIEDVGMKISLAQQYGILCEKGKSNPNPRRQFIKDMKKWIKKLRDKMHIVLTLDANEEWVDKTKKGESEIHKMAVSVGLRNLEMEQVGKLPSTFPLSGITLDHILVSEGVLDCTEAIARPPHINSTLGDHRGTYVDLNVEKLLGIGEIDVEMNPMRKLQTKDIKATEKYLEKVEEALKNYKVFDRMETLWKKLKITGWSTKEDVAEYKKIDRDIFRLCRGSEKNVYISKLQGMRGRRS